MSSQDTLKLTYPLTGMLLVAAASHTALNRFTLSSIEQLIFFLQIKLHQLGQPTQSTFSHMLKLSEAAPKIATSVAPAAI